MNTSCVKIMGKYKYINEYMLTQTIKQTYKYKYANNTTIRRIHTYTNIRTQKDTY